MPGMVPANLDHSSLTCINICEIQVKTENIYSIQQLGVGLPCNGSASISIPESNHNES